MSDDNVWIEYPGKERLGIKSGEVNEVVSFKRDLVFVDLICVLITCSYGGQERVVEIHEEMRGFEEVMAHFARRLPGFDRSWLEKVVKPAFSTNRTVLYRRSA